jgi:triosephosphate isomerase
MLIAGNWKMFKGPNETAEFCRALRDADLPDDVDVVVCPPYLSLEAAVEALAATEIGVFAQNVHWELEGAFTGEVAAPMLEQGLDVIFCVGETEAEREAGQTEDVLRRQLDGVEADDQLVIAYEPVWAIGTGRTATPELAHSAHELIKSLVDVPVLYGGSVKPENAGELMAQGAIDGALVGGASLDVESFAAICRAASL